MPEVRKKRDNTLLFIICIMIAVGIPNYGIIIGLIFWFTLKD